MWVECELTDLRDQREPPDLSQVPGDRRELVRQRWDASFKPKAETWKLWSGQIDLYRRSGFDVQIEGDDDA